MIENNLTFIDTQLQKFNVSDSAIAELAQKYIPLVVNGIDDKEGLKVVKDARLVVKRYRIDIDKRRKELTADALELQRRINAEAKRITALLEPIESHLEAQEKKVADELERIKREKEEAEQARYLARVEKLTALKFMFDGIKFYTSYLDTFTNAIIQIPVLHIKQCDDVAFDEFIENASYYFEIEQKAIAEKAKQEEENREALAEARAKLEALAKASFAPAEESFKLYEESKAAVLEDCDESCEHFKLAEAEQDSGYLVYNGKEFVIIDDDSSNDQMVDCECFKFAISFVIELLDHNIKQNEHLEDCIKVLIAIKEEITAELLGNIET